MASAADPIEELEAAVMSGLKDFQQATVCRIDQLYRNGQMRVLVSDEVGLGKTLVARGVVVKLARMEKEEGKDLVKVVYICSNAAIADQNLNKLRISREVRRERVSYSRLSMQHLNIFQQENDPEWKKSNIQLIPLTPDTSFRMTSGAGTVNERALMYAILKRLPVMRRHQQALEAILKAYASVAWDGWAKKLYEAKVTQVDQASRGRYLKYMLGKLKEELETELEEGCSYKSGLLSLCRKIEKNGCNPGEGNDIIGKLRVLFAKISLDKLEPDLVILDEFQRFQYLIHGDPESETGMLAGKFFNSEKVRMLLLSATPYKMYSTLEEIDETDTDEHFSEFLNVMRFLNITPEADKRFREIWNQYSVQLKELTLGNLTVIQAKNAAEDAMYHSVCRTERISARESADLMDDTDVRQPIRVWEQDIRSYLQAQKLLDDIGAPFSVPVDYIKSTPYLMSFMRDYQLKRYVEKYFTAHPEELSKIKGDTFWLSGKKMDRYDKLSGSHGRLDHVTDRVFRENAELLLWVPPAKSYYTPQGVFKKGAGFSKTLIFSSWEMVPRMIAGMISYEAERRTVGKLARASEDRNAHYFTAGEKRYPSARLTFSVSKGIPARMMLFCLIYPSRFLSGCYDPLDCMNRGLSLSAIEREIRGKISEKLDKLPAPKRGQPDRRWYYMAPLFLDGAGYVTHWMNNEESLASYDDEKTKKQKGFIRHMDTLRVLYREMHCGRKLTLGRKPADLARVLTDMAIASPAVCMNRIYERYKKKGDSFESFLPSQIARLFINRMNTTEATAAIEIACGRKSEEAHWQNVLTYCKQGNLQAMLDEYAHLLANGFDEKENRIENLHKRIADSMDFRTTVYEADTLDAFKRRVNGAKKDSGIGIRSHFAAAFTKGDSKEADTDRKKKVRNAFNSPFRPFVLASTSIGQEGLDFHNYCRRIVHWNLPSNPVDLEQREGRIHRFKCLAIRQNVARRYGSVEFKKDVWEEMFEEARRVEKTDGCSDLIPYWGLKETKDMVKIERIVPMYPFSRDINSYERLIKILSLYRLTLGQARQEELLEYILDHCENLEDMQGMFMNLSPFYRGSGGK